MNTTSTTIQDHPTNKADCEYFESLTIQAQDAIRYNASSNLIWFRMTVAAAWKSAIQSHKDSLRARYGAKR